MRNAFSAVFIAAALTIAAVPALAHHSLFAVFDEEQTVTLKGVHVVERFRREGDVLAYSATVEDSVVFTGPWQTTPRTLRLQTAPRRRVDGISTMYRAELPEHGDRRSPLRLV